jgi:hypothetical protein
MSMRIQSRNEAGVDIHHGFQIAEVIKPTLQLKALVCEFDLMHDHRQLIGHALSTFEL